jgi:hypothetical protein
LLGGCRGLNARGADHAKGGLRTGWPARARQAETDRWSQAAAGYFPKANKFARLIGTPTTRKRGTLAAIH